MTGLRMFHPWRGKQPMDSIADTAEIRGAGLRMRVSHGVASRTAPRKTGHIAARAQVWPESSEQERN
jgi:hypothetical protein